MATYTGKETVAPVGIESAFEKISNLKALEGLLERMPEEARQRLGDTRFTDDEIIIGNPQLGNITMKLVERVAPTLLRFKAQGVPVDMSLAIKLRSLGEASTGIKAEIDIELPAMLRPLVGGKLQEAADRFGDLVGLVFAI